MSKVIEYSYTMKYLFEYGTMISSNSMVVIEISDIKEAIDQFCIRFPGKIIWKITMLID